MNASIVKRPNAGEGWASRTLVHTHGRTGRRALLVLSAPWLLSLVHSGVGAGVSIKRAERKYLLDPDTIRFSHSRISDRFSCGRYATVCARYDAYA